MSETAYMLSTEQMQTLADADGILADLALTAMMLGDGDLFTKTTEVGLPLFEFQEELVERGLAEARMDRSDREEEFNV